MHAEPQFPRTLPDDDPRLRPTAGIDTPERRALRREIVERHLAGSAAVEGRAPVLFLMGGGGASGKGHVKDRLVETGDIPAGGAVQLDPDEIKGNFPEYRELVAAGDSRAAAVVHEESSAVAKGILGAAMDGRRDIVYDVTLGNPDKGRALIDSAKAAGYDVHLFGVTVDTDVAVQRNAERAARTGRYVPVESQLAAHRGFSEGFESYAARADRARLYDTNGPDARVIAVKEQGGDLVVVRPEEYRAFEAKAGGARFSEHEQAYLSRVDAAMTRDGAEDDREAGDAGREDAGMTR
jgi:predicted ABC-type ATPase